MTLNLFIVVVGKKVDEGDEKIGLNDGRLVVWVDGHVAHTGCRRQDEGEEGRLEKT